MNPVENWRTFVYTAQSDGVYRSLTEMRDSAGKVIESHLYDGDDRGVTSVSEAGRDSYTFEYDKPAAGQTRVTRKISDSSSQVTVFILLRVKGAIQATQIDGACPSCGTPTDSQTFTYDSVGRPLSSTDAGGHTTRYTYDSFGNILTKTEAAGTSKERTTTFTYDYSTWPSFIATTAQPSATGNGLHTVQREWNSGETVLTTLETGKLSPDPNSSTTYTSETSFDAKHRPVSYDGPRTDTLDISTLAYYADDDPDLNRRGKLRQVTSAAGLITSYDDYDVYGTAQTITDPNGVITQLQTDARGRITSTNVKAVGGDPNEATDYLSSLTYDGRDRITERINPRGNKTRYAYEDGTNALTDATRVDAAGNERERKHLTLNLADDKIAEEDQSCTTPAPTCTTWTTKRNTTFVYDSKDRLVEIDQPVPANAKILYQYDADGQLQAVQDEDHSSPNTTYAYDELHRLSTVTQTLATAPGGSTITRYSYDPQDNLTGVTDPNGNNTTYAYDDFRRMQSQTSAVTGVTTYGYDAAGNLTSTTDANGATTTRSYDAANRVTNSTSTRAGSNPESVTWTYDSTTLGEYGKGRIASVSDPTGTITYGYDRRGLLQREQRTIAGSSYTTTYAYDAAGNRTQVTYPSGRAVTYSFDFAERPASATTGSITLASAAAYAPFGPLTQLTLGNGTTRIISYDFRYRPTDNKLTGPAGVIADYTYGQDAAGIITGIHDATNSAYNRDFTYDDLNRLTAANSGSGLWETGTYSYDPLGNLLTKQIGASSSTFTYVGTTPQLSAVTENGTPRTVTYDSAGNEASVGANAFTYTPRNSLATGEAWAYTYDGRGVRTISTSTAATAVDSMNVTPSTVNGRDTATGSVQLTAPAEADATVALTSSDLSIANIPTSVTVQAGATSATFAITTSSVLAPTAVTIAAQLGTVRSAVVTVQPAVAGLSSITVDPSAVSSPQTATGKATLSDAAPAGGVSVALTSSNTAVATLPETVTINESQTAATFPIQTKIVTSPTAVTISGTFGEATKTATLTVNPCSTPVGQAPASFPDAETLWYDDTPPNGAVLHNTWQWDTTQKASGTQSTVDSTITGQHEHWFENATATLTAAEGELFFMYVYIDPCNPPREIMLGWEDSSGNWDHRAFWGENIVNIGTAGNGRQRVGGLPATMGWVRLDVPASRMKLAGQTIKGMALTVYGGRVWFDRAGKASCSTAIAAAPSAFPPGDFVWVDDALPAGASPSGTWNWDPTQAASGTQSLRLYSLTSNQDAIFDLATTTMNTGANDTLFAYVLVDPCEPPREIVMRWNAGGDWGTVAYWGDDFLRYGYALRLRFGPVPNSGGWIRLEVPASYLGRASKNIRGLQLTVYGGRAWVDHVGKTSCTTPIASTPSSFPGAESVWFDDNIPSGASRSGTWNWDTTQKASGAQSHTTPVSAWGSVDDHSFTGATSTLQPTANDDLFAYVLMDPCFPPREIMIGWYDGSWEHRAYWGDDVIGEGSYPNGRFYMGPLPPAGQWIKLAVPAAKLGLAGRTITGMIFSVQAGKVWFDRAGKTAGTVAELHRPAAAQYALLRSFGIDRFGTPAAALWDFDRPIATNDAPVPVRRYFFYTPELNLMAETELTANAAPAVQYEYIWFGGQPLAQVMSATNQILWYFDDHLGTPILQTDSAGAVVWRAEYEPYGSIYKLRVAANPHQPLRLPGQEAEQLDTGTNGATERSYNIFRWYRGGWGRYTQADPVGLRGGSPNVYAYGRSNPYVFTDALGLRCSAQCPECPGKTWFFYGLNAGFVTAIGSLSYGTSIGIYDAKCTSSSRTCTFIVTCSQAFGLGLVFNGGFNVGVAFNAPCSDDIAGVSFGASTNAYGGAGASGSGSISPSGASQIGIGAGFGPPGASGTFQLCQTEKLTCR